jgi:hypothetical protein
MALMDFSGPKWCPWNRSGAARGFLQICDECRKQDQRPGLCQLKEFMKFAALVSIVILIYTLIGYFS